MKLAKKHIKEAIQIIDSNIVYSSSNDYFCFNRNKDYILDKEFYTKNEFWEELYFAREYRFIMDVKTKKVIKMTDFLKGESL